MTRCRCLGTMAKAPNTTGEGSAHEENPSPLGLRAMLWPQVNTSLVSKSDFLAYKALHTHSTRGGCVAAPTPPRDMEGGDTLSPPWAPMWDTSSHAGGAPGGAVASGFALTWGGAAPSDQELIHHSEGASPTARRELPARPLGCSEYTSFQSLPPPTEGAPGSPRSPAHFQTAVHEGIRK